MSEFWQLNIRVNAIDGFLYMGRLFLILDDGTLRAINLDELSKSLLSNVDKNPYYADYIFFNNHRIPKSTNGYYNYWAKRWDELSTTPIDVKIDSSSLPVIANLEAPVLDIKIYGKKLILATRAGVFEAALDLEEKTTLMKGLEKVFDSKSTFLSAKAGEVFISSVDGLFRGSYWNKNNTLEVDEKPIESTSLRTNWRVYDLLNFEESSKFNFYFNKTEKVDNSEFSFLADDGERELKRITDFGTHQFSSENLFKKGVNLEDILFSFNSNSYIFVIFKNGEFQTFEFSYENYDDNKLQAFKRSSLPMINVNELGRPLSALTVPKGTVIEFFDKLLLIKNGVHTLEKEQLTSMRTYPTSMWYKNIITAFKEDHITVTALNPFEKY